MRVVLDADPGNSQAGADIDDGLALALLLKTPETDLQAVTVVGGNVGVDEGVLTTLGLLSVNGSETIPVYRGADRPLIQDPDLFSGFLRQRRADPLIASLWSAIEFPTPTLREQPGNAARVLVDTVLAYPGEVTILAIGPLTNVATACLLDSRFAQSVARIIIMGGVTAAPDVLHELNFAWDPEAAPVVLTSGAPITIVPLDVTLTTNLTLDDNRALQASADPLVALIGHGVEPYIRLQMARGRTGCPLHDPLAVVALIRPDLIAVRQTMAAIDLQSELTRGRLVTYRADQRYAPTSNLAGGRPIQLVTGVDNGALVTFVLQRLTGNDPG